MPFLWLLWSLLSIALFRIWPPDVSKIGSTLCLFDTLLANALFSLHKKHTRNLFGVCFLVRRFLVFCMFHSLRLSRAKYTCIIYAKSATWLKQQATILQGNREHHLVGWRRRSGEHFIYQSVARKMLYPRFIVTEKMLYRCQTTNSGAAKNINAWISYLSIFRDRRGGVVVGGKWKVWRYSGKNGGNVIFLKPYNVRLMDVTLLDCFKCD